MVVDVAASVAVVAAAGFLLASYWSATVEVKGADARWRVRAEGRIGGIAVFGAWEASSPAAASHPGMAFDPKRVSEGIAAFRIYRYGLEDLWRHLRFDQVEVEAAVGLGSPARTAWAVGALSGILGWWLDERVAPRATEPPVWRIEPDWTRWTVQGRIRSRIRIRGWSLAGVGFRTVRYAITMSRFWGRVRAWKRMPARFEPGSTR